MYYFPFTPSFVQPIHHRNPAEIGQTTTFASFFFLAPWREKFFIYPSVRLKYGFTMACAAPFRPACLSVEWSYSPSSLRSGVSPLELAT